jgi:hypothetical protein
MTQLCGICRRITINLKTSSDGGLFEATDNDKDVSKIGNSWVRQEVKESEKGCNKDDLSK